MLQISDDQPRGLVDERFDRFVGLEYRMVQDGGMRQRLDRRHAYECCHSQIDAAKLIAVASEERFEKGVVLPVESFDVLEPSRARNLLRKHAVQLGVDAMRLDRCSDELPYRLRQRERRKTRREWRRLTSSLHATGSSRCSRYRIFGYFS